MNKYLFTSIYILLFVFSFVWDGYFFMAFALFIVLLFSILQKLGKGIVLRESIAFFFVFTCLVMPILGYNVYNADHHIASLFNRYMQVSVTIYFGYALPALLLFTICLTFPLKAETYEDQGKYLFDLIVKIKNYLNNEKRIGILILVVGTVELFLSGFIPIGIRFFIDLIFFSAFAGVLMIYFGENKFYKITVLPAFLILLFLRSIDSSMFTIIAYMSITLISFFMIGNNVGIMRKIIVFIAGCFLMLVLQNSKLVYRKIIKQDSNQRGQVSLFLDIVQNQFLNTENFFQVDEFYQVFIRLNQGYNVSRVMKWIPYRKDFDKGDRLGKVVLSTIVPRFLWPDKPKAGGQDNVLYYAGWRIQGWSTNVGPLGEGYGAFGVVGGILFMGLLGIYIRFVYVQVWKLSLKYPIMICWLPVLFYQTVYSAETDTLQILNSTVKTSFFLWLLSKVQPRWFGLKG
jgi:hypothetical protein